MQKGDKHLLDSFIAHFTRAVNREIEVMRERMRAFEIQLDDGQRVEGNITSYYSSHMLGNSYHE